MHRYLGIAILAVTLFATFSVSNPPAKDPAPKEPPFHVQLKKIAAEYKPYGRVDNEMRWAPYLCRMPMPGMAHFSESKDDKTHGQKMYSLFVKDRLSFLALDPKKPNPVGQTIVKQSWIPEEVPARKPAPFPAPGDLITDRLGGDHFYPYAGKDGKTFKASKQGDLFIMFKLDPKTEGTDEGWVYGTVTPDGKKVTSAGKVESCMKCHVEAKHDRLFGLDKKRKLAR